MGSNDLQPEKLMAKVVVSIFAISDQDEILRTLHRTSGLATVMKYDAAFRALLQELADFPGIGAPRSELGEGIRIVTINPYVVIYEGCLKAETVVVHRIVHGRRDIHGGLIER